MLSDTQFLTLFKYLPIDSIWHIQLLNKVEFINQRLLHFIVNSKPEYEIFGVDISVQITEDSKSIIQELVLCDNFLSVIVHQYVGIEGKILFVAFDYTESCLLLNHFLPKDIENDYITKGLIEFITMDELKG